MSTFSDLAKLISDSQLSAPNPFAGDDRVSPTLKRSEMKWNK